MREYFISFEFKGVYGGLEFDGYMSAIIEYDIKNDSMSEKAKKLVRQELPKYKNTELGLKIIAFNPVN